MPVAASERRTARVAGWWFVITFVTSIPAVLLYDPLLNDANYILGAGADTRIELGALLEIGLAISGIATAVVLFPIIKRQSEGIALGYVACRVIESAVILVGVVSVLSVVTLQQDLAGPAADGSLGTVGRSLVAVHDATFLLGPGFCPGLGNGLLLGWLLYRSGLVPRRLALIGVIGGPLCFLSAIGVLFDLYGINSGARFIGALPEVVWEASLGIYLIVKGFRPSPILLGDANRQPAKENGAAVPPTVVVP
jgi:hypothetical protein